MFLWACKRSTCVCVCCLFAQGHPDINQLLNEIHLTFICKQCLKVTSGENRPLSSLALSLSCIFHLAQPLSFYLSLHLQTPFNLLLHLLLFICPFCVPSLMSINTCTYSSPISLKLLIGQNWLWPWGTGSSCCLQETLEKESWCIFTVFPLVHLLWKKLWWKSRGFAWLMWNDFHVFCVI